MPPALSRLHLEGRRAFDRSFQPGYPGARPADARPALSGDQGDHVGVRAGAVRELGSGRA